MSDFQSGDIVRLKSGGPKMTILGADGADALTCKWFDRNGKLHENSFKTAMIEIFKPRPPEEIEREKAARKKPSYDKPFEHKPFRG